MESELKKVVLQLDNKRDADWTEDGRPSLKRVRQLASNNKIEQADVDLYLADTRRVVVEDNSDAQKMVIVNNDRGPEDKGDPVKDVRMVAHDRGYYAGAVREVGDSFMFTGIPGRWMHEETDEEAENRKRIDARAARGGAIRDDVWAMEVSKATK